MILKSDSLLNYLPPGLDKRTLLVFDTIRFTLEVIDKNWTQLINNLSKHSEENFKKDLPEIFINAWSIVDNTQRFINLYELLPSDSSYKILDPIKHVKAFRNTFAHLDERIDESLLKTNSPFWGALTWEYRNDKIKKVQTHIAISGIQYGTQHNYTISKYEDADRQIFNIKLETVSKSEKIELNIEELIISIKHIIETLENDLETKFANKGLQRADWSSIKDILLKINNG